MSRNSCEVGTGAMDFHVCWRVRGEVSKMNISF